MTVHTVPWGTIMPELDTARWLGDPEPHMPAWEALHFDAITGTDIPKILGDSTRGNALSVWHHKRGTLTRDDLDDDPGEAAEWGVESEPMIARVWARRHATDGVPPLLLDGGMWQHREHPWMRAQLDRVVAMCPDVEAQDRILCALEIKTRSAFVAGKWRDDVPDDVLGQVAWQRMVTGLDHIHVACLVGGQRLVEHTYTRDDALEAHIAKAAGDVWQCVVDDVPPPVEWDRVLSQLLDVMVPDRSGVREVDAAEAAGLIGAWAAYQAARRATLDLKASAEGKIKAAFGLGLDGVTPAEVLTHQGEPLFTYREQHRKGYTVAPTSYRVLRGPDVD